jgi:hypothetical protein
VKIKEVLSSKYCWGVIFISIVLGYFLIIRKFTLFTSFWSIFFSIFYIILFAVSNSCLVKEMKERIKDSSQTGSSILSILGSVLGISAIQLCTVSGTCSVNIVTSLLLTVFPTSLGFFFIRHGIWILIISDILLSISILRLGCFKKDSK